MPAGSGPAITLAHGGLALSQVIPQAADVEKTKSVICALLMLRIAKLLGLGLVFWTMAGNARPAADAASFQVSLTIRDSCLVQSPQAHAGTRAQPQVSCLLDSPHLMRLVTPAAPSKVLAPSPANSMTWLVMF